MRKYEVDERVTFYFVIFDDGDNNRIQAWSDNKDYAKMYMNFHQCKNYKLKAVTKRFDDMVTILNENYHDEIELCNIRIKNVENHKKGHESRMVMVPLTSTEHMLVDDESVCFMASRVDYQYINGAFHYLKDKYQRVLKDIFLYDVMNKVIYEKQSKFTNNVETDDLMVLFRSFPDHFGK